MRPQFAALPLIVSIFGMALPAEPSPGSSTVAPVWISKPTGGSACLIQPSAGGISLERPYFAFKGSTSDVRFSCRETGPFRWVDRKQWYVQKIQGIGASGNPRCPDPGPCYASLVRACSLEARKGDWTPAMSQAGGAGCGVYEASAQFSRRP